jgi:hypothetical protein
MQSKANSRATDVNALGSLLVEGAPALAAFSLAEAFAGETETSVVAGKRRKTADHERR